MRSPKLPLLLIATGIFIPLVSVPFADGYRHNAGLIENIQSMSLAVMPDRYRPEFRPILTDDEVGLSSKSDQQQKNATTSKYQDLLDAVATPSPSGAIKKPHIDFEPISPKRDVFDELTSPTKADNYQTVTYGDSGKNVLFDKSASDEEIKRALKAGKEQIGSSKPKNLIFFGWTLSQRAVRLAFSFVISGSLLLTFGGVVLLILAPRRIHQQK
jgi:hypothetical protein